MTYLSQHLVILNIFPFLTEFGGLYARICRPDRWTEFGHCFLLCKVEFSTLKGDFPRQTNPRDGGPKPRQKRQLMQRFLLSNSFKNLYKIQNLLNIILIVHDSLRCVFLASEELLDSYPPGDGLDTLPDWPQDDLEDIRTSENPKIISFKPNKSEHQKFLQFLSFASEKF